MRRRAALVCAAAARAASASSAASAVASASSAALPSLLLLPHLRRPPSWWQQQRAWSSTINSSTGTKGGDSNNDPPKTTTTTQHQPPLPPLDVPALLRQVADADHAAHLTPEAVVRELDRHVVGQAEAKKAIATAFRARWRRRRVPDAELREAITPKSLLLIGTTGTGKTELARRLARIADAPFVKTEASSYTETGYHGRDVDQIARDLVENAVLVVRARLRRLAEPHVKAAAEQKLVRALVGGGMLDRAIARMEQREREKQEREEEEEAERAARGKARGGKGAQKQQRPAVSPASSSSSSSPDAAASVRHVVRQNPLSSSGKVGPSSADDDDDADSKTSSSKSNVSSGHAAEAATSAARTAAAAAAAAAAADRRRRALAKLRAKLRAGELDDVLVEVDIPPPAREAQGVMGGSGGGGGGRGGGGGGNGGGGLTIFPPTAHSPGGISFTPGPAGSGSGDVTINLASVLGGLFRGLGGRNGGGGKGGGGGGGGSGNLRRLPLKDARVLLEEAEAESLFPPELIAKEALRTAAEEGIVFIDEIDKIVQPAGAYRHGSDPSSEGVQRDLLPLLEGSGTVQTRLGPLSTQHVLFIAAGAFHHCSVSDMMPELQGRLPVRVQLKPLDADDFLRILTEPAYSAVAQQRLLLGAEGVSLRVTEPALRAIAVAAERANARTDDIGARRLHAVLERLLEEASFRAPELGKVGAEASGEGGESGSGAGATVEYVVDADMVEAAMAEVFREEDVAKYIL